MFADKFVHIRLRHSADHFVIDQIMRKQSYSHKK